MRTLLLALFAVSGAAHSITLDELLAKNLAARGGAANVQNLKSLRLTGRAFFTAIGRRGATLEVAWAQVQERPGKIRSEVTRWRVPRRGQPIVRTAAKSKLREVGRDARLAGTIGEWQRRRQAMGFWPSSFVV